MQSLNLKQQCILLAGLPLFLEFVCVSALLFLQSEAESELKNWIRARNIVHSINRINFMYHAMKLSDMNAPNHMFENPALFQRSKKEYNYLIKDIPAELKNIEVLLSNSTEEEKKEIRSLVSLYDARLPELIRWPGFMGRRALPYLDPGQIPLPTSRDQFVQIELRMLSLEHDIVERLDQVKKNSLTTIANHHKDERKSDNRMESLIYISMACNVLLGLALSWYFYRNTIARLAKVIDNSNRLKLGESLLPIERHGDELDLLDDSFYSMAQSLKENSRKNDALIRNSMDVLLSLDVDGRCIKVSPSALKVFGLSPDEMLDKPIAASMSGANRTDAKNSEEENSSELKANQFLENLIPCRRVPSHSFETSLLKHDESNVDLLWTARFAENSDQYFCVVHDITARKNVERRRKEIVQMVSHDLRTPLTTLMNSQETLEDNAVPTLTPDGKKRFENANRDIDNMLGLINDLLDLERVKAGMMTVRTRKISLDRIINESANGIVRTSQRNRIKTVKKPDRVELNVDADLICRVLTNMLLNGLERSPSNQTDVELMIELTKEGTMLFQIYDEGSRNEIPDFNSEYTGGLSFRLSLCKALIESHSGKIGVLIDDKSAGAIFWFELPSTVII